MKDVVKNINISVNLFIIPNPLEVNRDGALTVQCWGVEDRSDNISRHDIIISGREFSSRVERLRVSLDEIPITLFNGKKEGDVVVFRVPGEIIVYDEEKDPCGIRIGSEKVIVTITATLKQKGYRYERFGTFEEVMQELIAASKKYYKTAEDIEAARMQKIRWEMLEEDLMRNSANLH